MELPVEGRDNWLMSVVQECALVENAIRRARSLVSPHGSLAQVVGKTDIAEARQYRVESDYSDDR